MLHQWLEACAIDNANDAEDADAADFAASGDMPTVSPGGIEPRPNCLWTSQGGRVHHEVSCDWRLQPPHYLAKDA